MNDYYYFYYYYNWHNLRLKTQIISSLKIGSDINFMSQKEDMAGEKENLW